LFHVSAASLSAMFRKYKKRTPIEGLTFHDSRHEAITRLARLYSPFDLARIVGHKDIRQLMTYYNRTAADIAKEMREKQSQPVNQSLTSNINDALLKVDKEQLPNLIASLLAAMQSGDNNTIEISL